MTSLKFDMDIRNPLPHLDPDLHGLYRLYYEWFVSFIDRYRKAI